MPAKDNISNHSKARRKQLLDATLKVIARRGLTGITINDIAREAGCSYGVIAFHFETKERLLLSALDHLAQSYREVWRAALARTSDDPAEKLRALIEIDFDPRVAKSRHLAVWMAFWAEAGRVPAYRQHCARLKRESSDIVLSLIADLVAERGSSAAPELIAQGLYAITDGAWVYSHVTGQNSPKHRARSKQLCLTYLAAFFPERFVAEGSAASAAREGAVIDETPASADDAGNRSIQ